MSSEAAAAPPSDPRFAEGSAARLTLRGLTPERAFEIRAELNRLFASRSMPYLAQFCSDEPLDFSLEIQDRSGAASAFGGGEFRLGRHGASSVRTTVQRVVQRLEERLRPSEAVPASPDAPIEPSWCVPA